MSVYSLNGNTVHSLYDYHGDSITNAYDYDGNELIGDSVEEQTGVPYLFSNMAMTDSSGIATRSTAHVRNAMTGIKLTTSAQNTSQTVSFATNIDTNGERVGIWVYATRLDIGVWGGNNKRSYYVTAKVSLNGVQKSLPLRGGMNYYVWRKTEISSPITTITVEIQSSTAGGTIYLDSVEVGYYMTKKPIVMFNLDCSPNNFINSAGYNLFQRYGFCATLQYNLTSDATVGSGAAGYNATNHRTIVEAGHDYATYSGWTYVDTNVTNVPVYDDDTRRSEFETHADLMWHINNDNDVYAPSIVHSTGFVVGEVYDEELCDIGFPLIRAGNVQDTNACFASVDWDDYREISPFFWWAVFESGSDMGIKIKDAIYYAINNRMCLQIGCHTIEPTSYEPTGSNDMNIGVEAMEEILAYCKRKVDNNELIVCTTADFLRRTMPRDKYATWLEQRQRSFVY